MAPRIEDYALIGDCETAALVSKGGSIDWLCFPRFDSGACFAALIGTPENGRWLITPACKVVSIERRYRPGTLILETEFRTENGDAVQLIDFMPIRTEEAHVLRIVRGVRGTVPMRLELIIRLDYGWIVPWVTHIEGGIRAIAGPESLYIRSNVELRGENLHTVAEFEVPADASRTFELAWCDSRKPQPKRLDCHKVLEETEGWWKEWAGRCTYEGPWKDEVVRSLITLKGLTYHPTGGLVAAATTSLPEHLGGSRNWDYRFCWLRDATFTLSALMTGGYLEEAREWREWLLRAVAGSPGEIQIMYGIAGERRLPELELRWLPGYDGSAPVRIGNAAFRQHQLDVYGEVLDTLHLARKKGIEPSEAAWRMERALVRFLETDWQKPDEGIWEIRGPRRHFTHSKVMAWVAVDRAIKSVEQFGLEGPLDRWRALRKEIHDEVCREGFDHEQNSFVQYYGSRHLDASLLMLPLVGFLPATHPKMAGTIDAIRERLTRDGFVDRYMNVPEVDGLPPGEGAFVICTLWLADNLALQGKYDEAQEVFERVLSTRNDVGLLAEQYDPHTKRFLGNFPQALSHLGLITTAHGLHAGRGPAAERR